MSFARECMKCRHPWTHTACLVLEPLVSREIYTLLPTNLPVTTLQISQSWFLLGTFKISMLGKHGVIAGFLKDRKGTAQLGFFFSYALVGPCSLAFSTSHQVSDKPFPMAPGCDSQPKLPCPRALAWAALLESETALYHWLQMHASKGKGIR